MLNVLKDTGHVFFGTKAKVLDLMADGKYRSLMEIFETTKVIPTTSSSILRQFRNKPEKFGAMKLNKKRDIETSHWLYQLVVADDTDT